MNPDEIRRQQYIRDFLWLIGEIEQAKEDDDEAYLVELEEALCEGHC